MAIIGSTWVVVLRCYACNVQFTVKGIDDRNIGATADCSQCPSCGANGDSAKAFPKRKIHQIVELARAKPNF